MKNSPMNPFNPGMPIELSVMIRNTVAYTGMMWLNPPYSADHARVPAFINDADDQEERAGRNAVIDHLQDAALQRHRRGGKNAQHDETRGG